MVEVIQKILTVEVYQKIHTEDTADIKRIRTGDMAEIKLIRTEDMEAVIKNNITEDMVADTRLVHMVTAIPTDTKKHYGTKYDPNHVEATVKKVGEYAGAQEKYKKQSLNVKYSYDAVPTEYDYIEKYGWGSPTTVGSLYTGYGYGHHYPQQYGYGHHDSYGYKSKYGKKPMNEEEPEDNMEDGDWEEDIEEN